MVRAWNECVCVCVWEGQLVEGPPQCAEIPSAALGFNRKACHHNNWGWIARQTTRNMVHHTPLPLSHTHICLLWGYSTVSRFLLFFYTAVPPTFTTVPTEFLEVSTHILWISVFFIVLSIILAVYIFRWDADIQVFGMSVTCCTIKASFPLFLFSFVSGKGINFCPKSRVWVLSPLVVPCLNLSPQPLPLLRGRHWWPLLLHHTESTQKTNTKIKNCVNTGGQRPWTQTWLQK